MRKLEWDVAIKQLPRAVLFSFGIALCLFMIVSFGAMVLTDREHAFGPGERRLVFATAFVVSFTFFSVKALLQGEN